MMIFSPTHDFFSDEFQSAYLTGLRYTATDDTPRLRAAVDRWLADGAVVVIPGDAPVPTVQLQGSGMVSEPTQEG